MYLQIQVLVIQQSCTAPPTAAVQVYKTDAVRAVGSHAVQHSSCASTQRCTPLQQFVFYRCTTYCCTAAATAEYLYSSCTCTSIKEYLQCIAVRSHAVQHTAVHACTSCTSTSIIQVQQYTMYCTAEVTANTAVAQVQVQCTRISIHVQCEQVYSSSVCSQEPYMLYKYGSTSSEHQCTWAPDVAVCRGLKVSNLCVRHLQKFVQSTSTSTQQSAENMINSPCGRTEAGTWTRPSCGSVRLPLLPCSQLNLHHYSDDASASSWESYKGDCTRTVFFLLAVYLSDSRHFPLLLSWLTVGCEVHSHVMGRRTGGGATLLICGGAVLLCSIKGVAVLGQNPRLRRKKNQQARKNYGFTPYLRRILAFSDWSITLLLQYHL